MSVKIQEMGKKCTKMSVAGWISINWRPNGIFLLQQWIKHHYRQLSFDLFYKKSHWEGKIGIFFLFFPWIFTHTYFSPLNLWFNNLQIRYHQNSKVSVCMTSISIHRCQIWWCSGISYLSKWILLNYTPKQAKNASAYN